MRKCLRCGEAMTEGLNLVIDDISRRLEVTEKKLHTKNTTVAPKICLCAKCGHIELYVDDLDKVRKFM